jgi:hypothetical protein
MFDNFVLPELVELAKQILENQGEEGLINFRSHDSWCGCMGPQNNDILCNCIKMSTLETNMVEVVSQFDINLAKKIWLAQFVSIVATLPG